MTRQKARDWLQKHISTGFVDPKTHESSCREVVTYCQDHPDDRDLVAKALTDVIARASWASPSQAQNAAYLAVNLGSFEGVRDLVVAASGLDDPDGEYASVAIAAIRSLPGNGQARDAFLPFLFRWLRWERVAQTAFEALCELAPEDAGSFLLALAHYQETSPRTIEGALTHLYYRKGDTSEGEIALSSLAASVKGLLEAVRGHAFLPEETKARLLAEVGGHSGVAILVAWKATIRLSPDRQIAAREAGALVRQRGSNWGCLQP